MADGHEDKARPGVFISYSRKDAAAADRLRGTLGSNGFEVTLDTHDILPGEPWQERLGKLIEKADAVVFLVSPDSIASAVCDQEVNEAERLAKRLIPVVIRDADASAVPGRLKRLNYIFMRSGAEEAEGIRQLVSAIQTDIEWIREHTRLGELSLDWERHGHPVEHLLRGGALAAAEIWLGSRPREAPETTVLHRELIAQSRMAEQLAMERERARIVGLQRGLRALVTILVLAIAGLVAWLNQGTLVEQYQWRLVMKPAVVTVEEERGLASSPGIEFAECKAGCPAMVVVPAGSFMMGNDTIDNQAPRHQVTIARPFAVGRTPVTFAEWNACVEAGVCPRISHSKMWEPGYPVIAVSGDMAQLYVAWLARLTGKPYRLLSEAEWEYAARAIPDPAAPHPAYPWGDELGAENAYCNGCTSAWDGKSASPVASFKPNAFGLHDMAGNVWQWVEDTYHTSYSGAPADGSAWVDGGWPGMRVSRGGAFTSPPEHMRSETRNGNPSSYRSEAYGFRIARTLASADR